MIPNQTKTPKGYEPEAWEQAEIAWRNQNGGRNLSPEAREEQIKGFYEQIEKNNKEATKWEGKS